ncbi:MAG: hypothetical protein Q8T08_21020 [Ignavibacteria bacterium]|nr:hypothetical protein [Ignavibacteria bacterium]
MMKKIATLFIMSLMAGSSLKANPRQEFEAGLNTWAVRHPILNKFREQPIVWRTSRTVINKHPNASFEETLKLTIDESILHFIDTNGLYSDIVEGMDPVHREASKIIFENKLTEWQVRHPIIKKYRNSSLFNNISKKILQKNPNIEFEEALGLIIQFALKSFEKSSIYPELVNNLNPISQELQAKLKIK